MTELRIFSVPKKDEYLAAILELSGNMEYFGGIKSYLRTYEFAGSTSQSEGVTDHIRLAGEIALRLEPKNRQGVVSDRMLMGITHSIKRGLITGTKLTDIVHDYAVPDMYVLRRLNAGITHDVVREDGGDGPEFVDGLGMLPWGRMGLDLMGDEAESFLDDMANVVSDRPEHRALYKLGVGAVALTAYTLIIDENLTSAKRYFIQNDPSKELMELIASNTGE